MIYKFIDNNDQEIAVNSLSSLQALVDSETIKKNTKIKAGLRGKWVKAESVEGLNFEEKKVEEPPKEETEDIVDIITREPETTPPLKVSKGRKKEEVKIKTETKKDIQEEKIVEEKEVKSEEITEPESKTTIEEVISKTEDDKLEEEYADEKMEDINFFQSFRICFKKFVDFKGRASRSEYWWFTLFTSIISIPSYLPNETVQVLSGLGALIILLPILAVTVRRFHDINKSGWLVLISLIPLIGAIILLVMLIERGTLGKNRFGEYPLKFKNQEKKEDEQQTINQTIKDKNIFKYLFILAVVGLVVQFFVMGENDLFVKTKSSKEESKDDNLGKTDNLPKELFGVKILASPEKYLYENAQGREKDYGGILKHTWYRAKDIKNLVTNTFFDRYDIAVVDNSIAAIQANRIITGYLTQKEFKEACVDKRENFFTRFLKENNINREVFNRKYYKGVTKTNRIFFVDRISTDYNYNNNDLRLYFSCNYGFKLEGVEKINTTFIYRLSTSEASAAGEKYTNYKSTPKFNATYLRSISLEE